MPLPGLHFDLLIEHKGPLDGFRVRQSCLNHNSGSWQPSDLDQIAQSSLNTGFLIGEKGRHGFEIIMG